jgi:hypothetical protein
MMTYLVSRWKEFSNHVDYERSSRSRQVYKSEFVSHKHLDLPLRNAGDLRGSVTVLVGSLVEGAFSACES